MSSVEIAAANGGEKSAPASVGMVTHLKHLIESLPVCVMRTDLEGCLLAANDSALQLLGVNEHAKVLSKSLTERISAEHLEDWRGFLSRAWSEGASSVECELVDFTGAHRIIMVKAVAQPTHADGIQSLILTAKDLASRRRLERALNDHQGCATAIEALKAEVQRSETERQRLVALLETPQSGSGGQSAEQEAASEALKQQIAELQGALAAKEQEWKNRCDELTAQVAQHDTERKQLTGLVDERLAEQRQASEMASQRDAEHEAASGQLRDRIAELERSLAASHQEWQKRCDDIAAQAGNEGTERQRLSQLLEQRLTEHKQLSAVLAAREAECQQLSATLEQREAEHRQLSSMLEQRITNHQAADEALQQRLGELERALKASELDGQRRSDELTAQLAEHAAARLQLTSTLAHRDAERTASADTLQKKIGELEASLKTTEHEWQMRCDTLTAELASVSAERQRLTDLLGENENDHRKAHEPLQQRIDDLERSLKANEAEWEKGRVELSAKLAASVGVQERLSALLEERDDEHRRAVETLQQQIVECDRALAANDESWKQRCEELSSQLTSQDDGRKARWDALTAQLLEHESERRRLSDLLGHREAEQRRLLDDHAAEKIRIEQSIRDACERAHSEVDETRRREIESLRKEMGQLAADLQRTAEQLAQRTAEYERLTADMRACTQETVDPADVQRLMKSVAAYRIELVQITENTIRTLEPMATAGRVAIASSRELQAAVEAVDGRSRTLLAQCALDDANRPEIERLRRDSIAAASLVRQLLQVYGDSARATGGGPEAVGEAR